MRLEAALRLRIQRFGPGGFEVGPPGAVEEDIHQGHQIAQADAVGVVELEDPTWLVSDLLSDRLVMVGWKDVLGYGFLDVFGGLVILEDPSSG